MRTGQHFHKGYAIKNVRDQLKVKHSVFNIIPNCGRSGDDPVDATLTLRSARALIDIWSEAQMCTCGKNPLPHHYQCVECAHRRLHGTKRLRLIKRTK